MNTLKEIRNWALPTSKQRHLEAHKKPHRLRRVLPPGQILMIALGGSIGVTVFSTNGEIIHIAGPAGLLAAVGIVGITAICVVECLSEMVVYWPIPNAMVQYVRAFVDKDLGTVIGLTYWYTMASVFATLTIATAQISTYWAFFRNSTIWQVMIFYILFPFIILLINLRGVLFYGIVEGIAGSVKIIFLIVGMIFLFVYSAVKVHSQHINDAFEHRKHDAKNNASALFLVIPMIAYGFLGVEIVSVTAFEAADRMCLRSPTRNVAYIMFFLYFLCAVGEACAVKWSDELLPDLPHKHPGSQFLSPIIVLAAQRYPSKAFEGFFTFVLIFFCLTAANSALYASSRTLYGLARSLATVEQTGRTKRFLSIFGAITHKTHVPSFALVASFFAFFWLPFLSLIDGGQSITSQDLFTVMETIGSVGGLMVWASQCLAYLRFWWLTRRHRNDIELKYNRWASDHDRSSSSRLSSAQPVPALLGLIFCLLFVFIFSTATWWNDTPDARKLASAFAGPTFAFFTFWMLKLRRWKYLKGSVWLHLRQYKDFSSQIVSLEQKSGIDQVSDVEEALDQDIDVTKNINMTVINGEVK